MKKAIFLDRDGIINIDKNYVFKIEDFEFVKNIFPSLRYLQDLDFLLFIVTNQSGIGRKYYTEKDFIKLTEWMLEKFDEEQIFITSIEYCPHHPDDDCKCRKPKIGMIENILEKYDIDLSRSWLIGDRMSDVNCARNAGIKNIIRIDNNIKKINFSEYYYECKDINFVKEIIMN
ncbi:MAG: D-glycero-beta-D-manno-heptose 1,7-bisphosphate 7-phosphatase [Aliarcobacter sp.]|nr:D-glycero-beta-D-manno-heptose 1,7-bisphosphate 7-phosphatase [Aliarcobacter sp.]